MKFVIGDKGRLYNRDSSRLNYLLRFYSSKVFDIAMKNKSLFEIEANQNKVFNFNPEQKRLLKQLVKHCFKDNIYTTFKQRLISEGLQGIHNAFTVFYGSNGDSWNDVVIFKGLTKDQAIEEYSKVFEFEAEHIYSAHDCSGQRFSWQAKIHQKGDYVQIYKYNAIDC